MEELHSNKYNIPELGEIYLEILDTSGTFEFPAMRRLSIEKGDAFILVYSVADRSSWQEVIHLRQLILEEKQSQKELAKRHAHKPPEAAARSVAPAASKPPVGSAQSRPAAGRRLSMNQVGVAAESGQLAAPISKHPISHYNSQLSKLLQQQQPGGNQSKLQWMSIDEKESEENGLSNDLSSSSVASGAPADNDTDLRSSESSSEPEAPARPTSRPTPIVVVANKCDLDTSSYRVEQEEAEQLVRDQWVSTRLSPFPSRPTRPLTQNPNPDRAGQLFRHLLGQGGAQHRPRLQGAAQTGARARSAQPIRHRRPPATQTITSGSQEPDQRPPREGIAQPVQPAAAATAISVQPARPTMHLERERRQSMQYHVISPQTSVIPSAASNTHTYT